MMNESGDHRVKYTPKGLSYFLWTLARLIRDDEVSRPTPTGSAHTSLREFLTLRNADPSLPLARPSSLAQEDWECHCALLDNLGYLLDHPDVDP